MPETGSRRLSALQPSPPRARSVRIWKQYSTLLPPCGRSHPSLIWRHNAFTLFHDVDVIGHNVVQRLRASRGPPNFNTIHFLRTPLSEVHAQIVLRKITSAAPHLIDLRDRTSHNSNLRTQRKPVAARSHQLKGDPVVRVRAFVAQNRWRPIDVFHHHVNPAVVVEIPKSRAPAGLWHGHRIANSIAHIGKRAVPPVKKHKLALPVLHSRGQPIDLRIHMSIHHKQISPSVVIEIDATRSPPHKRNRHLTHTCRVRYIGESHLSIIAKKRITLILEVRHVDREAPRVIEIAYRDSHSGSFATIAADCRSRDI